MASMEVAAAARAAAQQRPHERWAAEFAGMSLRDHPQHVSGCEKLSLVPALACINPGGLRDCIARLELQCVLSFTCADGLPVCVFSVPPVLVRVELTEHMCAGARRGAQSSRGSKLRGRRALPVGRTSSSSNSSRAESGPPSSGRSRCL